MKLSTRASHLTFSEMETYCAGLPEGAIPFTSGSPGLDSMPLNDLQEEINALFAEKPHLFSYGDQQGDYKLRALIGEKTQDEGFATPLSAEEILITNGGMGAANLTAQLVLNPGDLVAVEDPSYPEALQGFQKEGVRLTSLPVDEEGIDPDELRRLARREKISLVYLIPHFQNPSGCSLSLERRKAIAQIAREENLTLFEDDPYRELWYEEPPLPSLRSLAPERVIYAGSFSKTVAPSLRCGWLHGPAEFMEKAVALQGFTSLGAPWILSRAIEGLLRRDSYKTHLEALRKDLEARLNCVLEHLAPLEGRLSCFIPKGGMFLWLELKGHDGEEVTARLREAGVGVLPGRLFSVGERGRSHIRLTYARQSWPHLREGLERMTACLERLK